MADPSPDPGTGDTVGPGDRGSMPGMPRWVRMSLIVALVVVLLVVILLLTGGHGPGRHRSSDEPGHRPDFDLSTEALEGTPSHRAGGLLHG